MYRGTSTNMYAHILWANFMLFTDLCVCTGPCADILRGLLKKGYDVLIPMCWASADDNPSIFLLHALNAYALMA